MASKIPARGGEERRERREERGEAAPARAGNRPLLEARSNAKISELPQLSEASSMLKIRGARLLDQSIA